MGLGGGGRANLVSRTYLFPSHVDQQLCATGAKGHVGGNQHSQTVVVVRQLHWQMTCREQSSHSSVRLPGPQKGVRELCEISHMMIAIIFIIKTATSVEPLPYGLGYFMCFILFGHYNPIL